MINETNDGNSQGGGFPQTHEYTLFNTFLINTPRVTVNEESQYPSGGVNQAASNSDEEEEALFNSAEEDDDVQSSGAKQAH
jgi:hypothetical protein